MRNPDQQNRGAAPTIGVFDSGVGGLTVLAALRSRLPSANFVYLGDTARVPYGPKSEAVVRRYACEAAWFLRQQTVDALVIACNSASAAAQAFLAETHQDIPVFGVIEPGAAAVVEASASGRIAVLGTRGTIASGRYPREISALRADAVVTSVPCPLFVPLAEEGQGRGEVADLVAKGYLAPVRAAGCDALLLGCTHYPLLRATIQAAVGPEVTLVDSAGPLAEAVATHFERPLAVADDVSGAITLFTTDVPDRFIESGAGFLGSPVPATSKVDLEALVLSEVERTGSDAFLTQREVA